MNSSFSVQDTFAVKGIAILMMYIHHNFLSPARWGKSFVDFWPLTEKLTVNVAVFFKICVSLFVFLSAYGLTIKYKEWINRNNKTANSLNFFFVANRLYKLELNFWFIFVLALLYSNVMGFGHFAKTYGSGGGAYLKCIIDGLGLAYLFKMPSFNATWWYMSLAVLIIILFPVLFFCYKHIGCIIVVVSWLLPIAMNLPVKGDDFYRYLPCMFIGIWMADSSLLSLIYNKLKEMSVRKRYMLLSGSFVVIVLMAIFSMYCRKYLGNYSVPLFNAILAVLIVVWVYSALNNNDLWTVLAFLGKHSMNMFMTHTFLRAYWYHDFIYSFKYAWLDTLVLLVITLLLSIVIEKVKDISGYNRIVNRKLFS